jgi:DNA modification methylase
MTQDESHQLLWNALQDNTISKLEAAVIGVDLEIYNQYRDIAKYKVFEANQKSKQAFVARKEYINRRATETITYNNNGESTCK